MQFTHTLILAAILVACSPSTHGLDDLKRQPDMAVRYTSESLCGSQQKLKYLAGTCQQACVPDEQIYFFCTERMGRIAYTRQGLMRRQDFGYSWEIKSTGCPDLPALIWKLVPISPTPTNLTVGKMSTSTVYSDCFGEPLKDPYIDLNQDRLYYIPTGPLYPAQIG